MWTSGSTSRSRVLVSLLVAVTGIVSVVASLSLVRDNRTSLQVDIDSILNRGENSNAFWGVYVRSLTDSVVVYERNSDKLLIPASNQKLLTTATALHFLTGQFRYQTPLLFLGKRSGGTITGDLVLVGSGDPTFGSRDKDPDSLDPLEIWAEQLYEMGIRKISGRIIGDDDVFDDELFGDGWDVSMLPTKAYAAPVGGLRRTLAGLRSRWMTSWSCAYAIAPASFATISAAALEISGAMGPAISTLSKKRRSTCTTVPVAPLSRLPARTCLVFTDDQQPSTWWQLARTGEYWSMTAVAGLKR